MESICAGRGENTVRSGSRFRFAVFDKNNQSVATEALWVKIVAFAISDLDRRPVPIGETQSGKSTVSRV